MSYCESIEFVIWYNQSEKDERGTGERRAIRSERTKDHEGKADDKKFPSKKVPLAEQSHGTERRNVRTNQRKRRRKAEH